ncbi:GNAT family N-acetyltransferase [Telmatocola sphagniphila]|uniref:GNAT family N-acetyltransferase n=1 Tax=Telmatocola sphagniphila TaxID=1123043 RepID=A0A8E6BB37_9BACT|nr:GNAT family N-acetyltransferase [Telmatocola sphagniphila]QVL33695.1 GNAT family N-acetyltransferase [Telmatocola sphagniphila]
MIHPLQPSHKSHLVPLVDKTGVFKPNEVETLDSLLEGYFDAYHKEDQHRSFVLEEEGHIRGFVYFAPEDSTMTDRTWTLYWIAVDVTKQRGGYGKKLMNFVEDYIRKENGRLLLIETSSTPKYEPTRNFYLKYGYVQVALVPDFYSDGDGKVIFAKHLQR